MGNNAATVAKLPVRSESGQGSDRSAAERSVFEGNDGLASGHAAFSTVLFTRADFDALGAAIAGNYRVKASASGGMAKNPFVRNTHKTAAFTQTISR